jgi:hypothetical protein
VPAEREFGVDPVLDDLHAERLEPPHLQPGERLELQVGQRPAAPQRLRFPQQPGGPARIAVRERLPPGRYLLLERVQVQLAILDPEQLAGRPGLKPRLAVPVGERLAQPGDLNPQHPVCRGRGLVAEQFLDQLVAGDDPVGMAQQQPEQRSLSRPADPHRGTIEPDLERPEYAEHQAIAHPTPPALSVLLTRAAG